MNKKRCFNDFIIKGELVVRKFAIMLVLLCVIIALPGCSTTDNGESEFEEDWYVKHSYYVDSNGNYFTLMYSESILQIEIVNVDTFDVKFSKYKMEKDDEYGNVYVYYDMDSYELVKYCPERNHTIVIETENGDIVCSNISEEEYLEAELNYANSQLEGFEEDWYKGKYLSKDSYEWLKEFYTRNGYSFDGAGCRQISCKRITDTSEVFILEVDPVFDTMSEYVTVEFLSDEYVIDYENNGYIYESVDSNDVIIYLEYFPKENKIRIYDEYESIGGSSVSASSYLLLTENEMEDLFTIKEDITYEEDTAYEENVQLEGNEEYILPGSDERIISKSELDELTKEEVKLARNEIYARHGRIFNDEMLSTYFLQFDWYCPTIEGEDFQESMLNNYEKENRDIIAAYEKEKGYK